MHSSQRSIEGASLTENVVGYQHPAYAQSLGEFGTPLRLDASGAWLLARRVPAGTDTDAMGCYPLFSARNWQGLGEDLHALSPSLVSVALVADPFGDYSPNQLHGWFERVVPFKKHYIADFSRPLSISKHHKYYAKRAASLVKVEVGPVKEGFCSEWTNIYESLVKRHRLSGIKAFSRAAFEAQLQVPGMIAIRAVENGVLVGAHLWYEQQGVAYSHLAAASSRGYELSCSYAIYSAALEYFTTRVKYVDFGAGAGTDKGNEGLSHFKSGWSNSTQPAYFCCRVLNPGRYEALSRGIQDNGYFPLYRSGEFA